jgi:hypothetical protein
MALTIDLNPCGWKDKEVWVRGIADLLIIDDDNLTAWVVDYKTGNNKYPDREQLKLMAMMVFKHFPHIRKVNAALLFVVKNDMVKYSMPLMRPMLHGGIIGSALPASNKRMQQAYGTQDHRHYVRGAQSPLVPITQGVKHGNTRLQIGI